LTRCTHCQAAVQERLAYQTHEGETLCAPCYFERGRVKALRWFSGRPGLRRRAREHDASAD
jgi:hypothetical protein